MSNGGGKPLYRHSGVALLRAAAASRHESPDRWPDLGDPEDCRSWLRQVWPRPDLAVAIRHASAGLARQVDAICSNADLSDKEIRRAAISIVRYLVRLTGRQTPFGLFAGVASADIGRSAAVRWGKEHQSFIRADAQWLGDVVSRLESSPELLDRLDVIFTNLAAQRGDDLEVSQGASRILIRRTRPVRAIQEAARYPIQFEQLVSKLVRAFDGVTEAKIRALATTLVRQGYLITALRAPLTTIDPLAHVICQLRAVEAPAAASALSDLESIHTQIALHNRSETTRDDREAIGSALTARMRAISTAGRTTFAADLRLDCDVQLPEHVVVEMSHAATALIRLTRQPTGPATWRDYYAAFCDRYGINALVPLTDVVNPETGLGLPATYPGSTLTSSSSGPSERDEKLLALAWTALVDRSREVVLTNETIRSLAVGDPSTELAIPPHIELAAQIRAASTEALDQGEYTISVSPGRSTGTFTARLAYLVPNAGLEDVYRGVPTAIDGALPVQLSFPPIYPHAENICRVPAYLPHLLPLGEHRADSEHTLAIDDLAVTATRGGLHLVSVSRQRVVEPQTFHALALEKQPPPLARLLAHLSRGMGAAWTRFDWGPAAQQLPYLPRVRYRRSILSPATWRLNAGDLPTNPDDDTWRTAFESWRERWGCPGTVEFQDDDRSLPLTLPEPAHAAIVRMHLKKHGYAVFTETAEDSELGWIGGHAHDVVVPLVTTRPPHPTPESATGWIVANRNHGQLAASPSAQWIYLKLHTHPDQLNRLISLELPRFLTEVDNPDYWFARYRSPRESDHLRLRLRLHDAGHSTRLLAAAGFWAEQLRDENKVGRLVVETYYPEYGRYGHGPAMTAAEAVFVADSQLVATQLRQMTDAVIHPSVLTAVNMLKTVAGFLGGLEPACAWLIRRPALVDKTADRSLTGDVARLAQGDWLSDSPGWNDELSIAWDHRAQRLADYRQQLPDTARINDVLESLLHMHHNRAVGIDRECEAVCRRLARQAAVAWKAQPTRVAP